MSAKFLAWMVASIVCTVMSAKASAQEASAQDPQRPACVIEASGLTTIEAMVAGNLVCGALHPHQPLLRPASNDAGNALEVYRVRMGRLGTALIVELVHERTAGTPHVSRQLRLARIEDMDVAAPRLVNALIEGVEIAATANVDNLVREEVRPQPLAESEFFVGLGVSGGGMINASGAASYGASIRLQHQTSRWALNGTGRVETGESSSSLSLMVGARYFLTDGNYAPFVGAHAGLLNLDVDRDNDVNEYGHSIDGTGAAIELEVGAEMLRFHDSRLGASLRVDVPVFSLKGNIYDNRAGTTTADSAFVLPVGVEIYYLF